MKNDKLQKAVNEYLGIVSAARSQATGKAYQNGLNTFLRVVSSFGTSPGELMANQLTLEHIKIFSQYLKKYSVATERGYMQIVKQFYDYLIAEKILDLNQIQLRILIASRSRRGYQRLPQFSSEKIEQVINYSDKLCLSNFDDDWVKLRAFRDRAFILTLADTGLRVHEACKLRNSDIDFRENKALVIGKGNRQAIVRFSTRSIKALQDYFAIRGPLEKASGKPYASLPVFSRHDFGGGIILKSITTATGRTIVSNRVTEALGSEDPGTITPHSFRHYFVTRILEATNNLKLAQELARHQSMQVTQRYAHLTDKKLNDGYRAIFDQRA